MIQTVQMVREQGEHHGREPLVGQKREEKLPDPPARRAGAISKRLENG